MTPMMSRPLPRPVGRKKFKSQEAAEKKKKPPAASPAAVAAAALVVGAAALIVITALHGAVKVEPISSNVVAPAETLVETDKAWMDPGLGRVKLEKAKKMLEKAGADKALTHTRVKTGFVTINLRNVVDRPKTKEEAAKAKPVGLEGASTGGSQRVPKPKPTDRYGKVIPGGSNEGAAEGGVVFE